MKLNSLLQLVDKLQQARVKLTTYDRFVAFFYCICVLVLRSQAKIMFVLLLRVKPQT